MLRSWLSACSVRLPMAVTPSFQLRIAHCLKNWIVDFLSFEMVYRMYKMDFRKCSKSAKEDCSCCPLFSSLCFSSLFCAFLAYFERLWKRAMELQSFVLHEFELFIALPWIPNNSPQSQIALVIKKLSKHQNLTQFD